MSAPALSSATEATEPSPPVVRKVIAQIDPDDPDDYPAERQANSCDFLRSYRGTIGQEIRVTLRPRLSGSGKSPLSGKLHYDNARAAIDLSGELHADGSFTLQEKDAGKFEGSCSAAEGLLAGTYTLKGKSRPFALRARPLGEAALYTKQTSELGYMPSHPACAKQPKSDTPTVLRGKDGVVLCFPEASKRRASYPDYEGPVGVCSLRVTSPQVFGLASEELEKAANGLLGHDAYPWWSRELRRTVKTCAYSPLGDLNGGGSFKITFNEHDVLGVIFSGGYFQYQSTVFDPTSVVLDLTRGQRVLLNDLIQDEAGFIKEARRCLPLYRKSFPAFFSSDDDFVNFAWKAPQQPFWTVVPGGIALLATYGSKVESALSGTGMVLSFEGLLRAGLLRTDSRLQRLWAGLAPAPEGVPTCTMLFKKNALIAP